MCIQERSRQFDVSERNTRREAQGPMEPRCLGRSFSAMRRSMKRLSGHCAGNIVSGNFSFSDRRYR